MHRTANRNDGTRVEEEIALEKISIGETPDRTKSGEVGRKLLLLI